jgi:hypothetical protein
MNRIRHAGAVLKDLPPAKDVRVGDEVKFFPLYGRPVIAWLSRRRPPSQWCA